MRSILSIAIALALAGAGALNAQEPAAWLTGDRRAGAGPRLELGAGGLDRLSGGIPEPVGVVWLGVPASQHRAAAADPAITGEDVLIAAAFVIGTVAVTPVDKYFAERLQDPRNQQNRIMRVPAEVLNVIAYPGSIFIGSGLYLHGILRDDRETAALGLHGLEAIAVGTGLAALIKGTVGRARPYLDVNNPLDFDLGRGFADERYRSFPSGHTVAGFAAATVVTRETSRWWPNSEDYIAPIMYVGASLIGVSRMYTNFHWASDVVMGAAIGTFAGVLINRYHRDQPDNWIDRRLLPDEGNDNAVPVLAASRYIVLWSIPLPR